MAPGGLCLLPGAHGAPQSRPIHSRARVDGLVLRFTTVGVLMQRFGALKPGRFASLRWSLFCGEPPPGRLAEVWSAAAPHSILENLYGPTELTVACTAYRWDPVRSPAESSGGLVPIGSPYPEMIARVVDERLRDVAPGEIRELLMSGTQCTPGYSRDQEATARAFVRLPGGDDIFIALVTVCAGRRAMGTAPLCRPSGPPDQSARAPCGARRNRVSAAAGPERPASRGDHVAGDTGWCGWHRRLHNRPRHRHSGRAHSDAANPAVVCRCRK